MSLMAEVSEEKSLSDGPAGVAPSPGPALQTIDNDCLWVARHASGWQFGEQGVIATIIEAVESGIPESDRHVVEFGAGDGIELPLTCGTILARPGWSGLLIEADEQRAKRLSALVPPNVWVMQERVEVSGDGTIDKRMAQIGCSANPGVMVIDIDSIDYYIAESMESRPGLLCIETLDIHSPANRAEPIVPPIEDCGKFIGDWFGTQMQANASAMDALIVPRGYKLVYRTRVNSIYLRDDLVPLLRRKIVTITPENAAKLPYGDLEVDEVYAPLTLNTVKGEDIAATLEEWVRVLKPNGTLRVCVPDIRGVLEDIGQEAANHLALQNVLRASAGGSGFTKESLSALMYRAGLTAITEYQPTMPGDPTGERLLNLVAKKRWFRKIEKPKVCLILSQNRLAFSGHERCLLKLSQKLNFETEMSTGAFWDKDMTFTIQGAIAKHDPDLFLFSDSDGIFEESDALTLMEAMQNDPQMAAIGAVQPSRHHDAPLVLDPTLSYEGDMTRVRFQHFGLMLIRREVFEEMPQPWFWSVPSQLPNGDWDWSGWTRSDADITFWRNMEMLGLRVYQHNRVNIGHLTLCVKYVRDDSPRTQKIGGVQLVPIENYWKFGKPKNAVFVPSLYQTAPPKETTT